MVFTNPIQLVGVMLVAVWLEWWWWSFVVVVVVVVFVVVVPVVMAGGRWSRKIRISSPALLMC